MHSVHTHRRISSSAMVVIPLMCTTMVSIHTLLACATTWLTRMPVGVLHIRAVGPVPPALEEVVVQSNPGVYL